MKSYVKLLISSKNQTLKKKEKSVLDVCNVRCLEFTLKDSKLSTYSDT